MAGSNAIMLAASYPKHSLTCMLVAGIMACPAPTILQDNLSDVYGLLLEAIPDHVFHAVMFDDLGDN
jgi:hypothetical protein